MLRAAPDLFHLAVLLGFMIAPSTVEAQRRSGVGGGAQVEVWILDFGDASASPMRRGALGIEAGLRVSPRIIAQGVAGIAAEDEVAPGLLYGGAEVRVMSSASPEEPAFFGEIGAGMMEIRADRRAEAERECRLVLTCRFANVTYESGGAGWIAAGGGIALPIAVPLWLELEAGVYRLISGSGGKTSERNIFGQLAIGLSWWP